MSILGLITNVSRAVVGVATLPISLVADVVTIGGFLSDKRSGTYTGDRARDIMDALDDAARGDE